MRRILAVAFVAVLAVSLAPSAFAQCTQNCDGLPSDPPHNPDARTYVQFITLAYSGAYSRFPTCEEREAEYYNLVYAASTGNLAAEARRFVATLFMTQDSYDVQDLTTYTQTAEYEARNANSNVDRPSLESFVSDLYYAFLQRQPDAGGLCFWTNDSCGGRKHVIRAFEVSIEFGNLINGLYDGGAPPTCGGGGDDGCPTGHRIGQLCE